MIFILLVNLRVVQNNEQDFHHHKLRKRGVHANFVDHFRETNEQ